MANAITDQHNMVKRWEFTGGGWPWGQQVRDRTGFSMEVFRNGHHNLSLSEIEGFGRLHKGDEILEVNLGPVTLSWQGSLFTADGYTRQYDARVTVRVPRDGRSARIFAERYLQQVDPLERAREEIDMALVRASARDKHDDLIPLHLRAIVIDDCKHLAGMYGVALDSQAAMVLVAHPDPRMAEISQVRHDGIITDMKGDISRVQKKKDADLEVRIEASKQISTAIRIEKIKQLQKYLRDGWSLRDIVEMDEDMGTVLLAVPEYEDKVKQILLDSPQRRTIDAPRPDNAQD